MLLMQSYTNVTERSVFTVSCPEDCTVLVYILGGEGMGHESTDRNHSMDDLVAYQ